MKKHKKAIKTESGEIAIYQPEKNSEVKVQIFSDTLWLIQAQVAELFGAERSVITMHIRNVLNSKELEDKSVCAKFAHTAENGKLTIAV